MARVVLWKSSYEGDGVVDVGGITMVMEMWCRTMARWRRDGGAGKKILAELFFLHNPFS